MTFHDWLKGFATRWSRQTRHTRPTTTRRVPLAFDALEERTVPSFASPVNYPAGPAPAAIVSGDFDNDFDPDLALVNPGTNTVSVLLGNGDGTFAAAPNATTGATPVSIAVGDFDGDTNLDIATANADSVSVLLGNGDGTFDPPNTIPLSDAMPASVAVGDFNGDGLLDLGVASNQPYYYTGYYGGTYVTYSGAIDVLIGDGDGGFTGAGRSDLGIGWYAGAAVGDFNGDGRDDLATINTWYSNVDVMLSDSAGSPIYNGSFYSGGSTTAVIAADVDGDTDADLVTANGWSGNVGILPGNGAGSFGAAQTAFVGGNATAVEVGDFNDDSRKDIAVTNGSTNNVNVVMRRTDGTYSPAVNSVAVAGSFPRGIAVGDFDDDGWLDAATANYSNNTSVLLNDAEWLPANAPRVTINDVSVIEGQSGTVNAKFTVTLSETSTESITVHYATATGTAGSGDFTSSEGDIVFAPGQLTQEILIPVVGDTLAEPSENFVVNIGPANAFVIDAQGVGTIHDDDIRITISNVTKKEGTHNGNGNSNKPTTTQFIFTVTLSAPAVDSITVNYATDNGSATLTNTDYQSKSGTLFFSVGQTSQNIVVLVTADKQREGDEWFAMNLSGSSTNALILDSQGIATIVNDDRK